MILSITNLKSFVRKCKFLNPVKVLCACTDVVSGTWQVFQDTAELGEAWLASKEAFLTNEDLGVSASQID